MTTLSNLHRAHHVAYATRSVAHRRERSVAVVVPTLDEAATIEATVATLVTLRRQGVVDRVLVADASSDDTPRIAERAGAEVVRQWDLHPELGAVLGKGDAMWRAASICSEDVLCFVDGDSADFGEHLALALIGATAMDGHRFAKATYERPFLDTTGHRPTGGGRVTELTAKPLLAMLLPELTAFGQPLAGEIAIDRELLRALPLATGYAVDVALLIDVWRAVGLGAMVEVDLGTRQNRHRPLHELTPMAAQVAAAILDRTGRWPEGEPLPFSERPPLAGTAND
ncbi:MAG: glucosyl-3-phosphoglycerate synthase [Solirubrobacteraceae bacterium]|nr:glucosyl-3-phosphoglycerate synthase [Solirubrobacteraceae bacterium]